MGEKTVKLFMQHYQKLFWTALGIIGFLLVMGWSDFRDTNTAAHASLNKRITVIEETLDISVKEINNKLDMLIERTP